MKGFLISFGFAYVQIGLICTQVLALTAGILPTIFIISLGLSTCSVININRIVKRGFWDKVGYVIGSAFGSISSVYVKQFLF